MHRLLFACFALLAQAASIRDVDFKNFTYPFIKSDLISVPGDLRWMKGDAGYSIPLRNAEFRPPCDTPIGCPSFWLNKVAFGSLNGIPGTSAIVTIWYSTGGTANWQYLYVVTLRSGKPEVLAWLETGSRADMGLRKATVQRGDLVLVVSDPDKREADCCSTGSITYRYRWQRDAFFLIGPPEKKDDPPR